MGTNEHKNHNYDIQDSLHIYIRIIICKTMKNPIGGEHSINLK